MKSSEHLVFAQDPNPQSLAALVLLTRHFNKEDRDNPFHWMKFRAKFVRTRNKRCEYCGRTHLKHGNNKADTLTVDHAIPLSCGGKKFDERNLRISCHSCNAAKTTMSEFSFRWYLLKNSWKHRKSNGIRRFYMIAAMFLIALFSGNNFGFVRK